MNAGVGMPGPHDKILAEAAKVALQPLGFRRKGRSRVWYADHAWWLTVVEFQPSAWSKGSYLNVAAHWLWSELGVLSFDFGGRIAEFEEYKADEQFVGAASKLAQQAANEARRIAETFSSLSAVADTLLVEPENVAQNHIGWDIYHAGIAAGLTGRLEKSAEMLRRIASIPPPPNSLLHSSAERMAKLISQPPAFRQEVALLVERQRNSLKLPPLATSAL